MGRVDAMGELARVRLIRRLLFPLWWLLTAGQRFCCWYEELRWREERAKSAFYGTMWRLLPPPERGR